MQPITIIALANGGIAIGFIALWWRNRKLVEIAETARDMAEFGRQSADAKANARLTEIVSLNAKIDGLELQAKDDGKQLSRLRDSGQRAAEKIAELEPLAAKARAAQAQRIAASKAAHAKRRERTPPPVDTSAMPRRARRVGKAN